MAEELSPYKKCSSGELIRAEDCNKVQVMIKEDIRDQIAEAKKEVIETGVERADNADKFDNKTPGEWVDQLDDRYAPKVHDHEGQAVYRRYFKRLRPGDQVVLEHNLGRFPLAEVYELLMVDPDPADSGGTDPRIPEKFYLYYHHEERDRDRLFTEDRGVVRWPWGTLLEQLLDEYQVGWEDDDSLGDVVNDFLDAFFKPPVVDHMDHKTSKWIDDHRESVISDLKKRDEWPDIRWVVRPQKLVVGSPVAVLGGTNIRAATPLVNLEHLSYNTLLVQATDPLTDADGTTLEAINLMILLRS